MFDCYLCDSSLLLAQSVVGLHARFLNPFTGKAWLYIVDMLFGLEVIWILVGVRLASAFQTQDPDCHYKSCDSLSGFMR